METGLARGDFHNEEINILFFWAYGCTYCEEASQFLETIKENFPDIQIEKYEVYLNAANRSFYEKTLRKLGVQPQGMPTIIIENTVWSGFQPYYEQEIWDFINERSDWQTNPAIGLSPSAGSGKLKTKDILNMPFFGEMKLDDVSLFAATAVIAFVDGFNPCSLWMLSILLSLAMYTKSRRKTFLIGFSFLLVSGAVYSLFIMGVFNLIKVLKWVQPLQILASCVAFFIGIINIKDYFWFKEGLSLSIPDRNKPDLYQRIRTIVVDSHSIFRMIAGTVILAIGVSFLEFTCTAGFPVIWSNLLHTKMVSPEIFFWLLLVYMLIYFVDEMIVFLLATITMQKIKMSEENGRFIKLTSGLLLAILAIILLFDPSILDRILHVLLVFGGTLLAAFLVHGAYQKFYKANPQ